MEGTTRTSVVRRAVLLAAGAVGLGAGGAAAAAKAAPEPARAKVRGGTRHTLTLVAPQVRTKAGAGGAAGASADLLDAANRPTGRFSASALAGGAQLHTFSLPGGTIFGLAGGALGDGAHAIVGGTGRYAGATGTYLARPLAGRPGRAAELTLTFTTWEA